MRDYRLHLISWGLKPNSITPIMGALRFFYRTTLGLKEVSEQIPYARRADPLPAVLARDEVVRFSKAAPDLKMRTLFITIYTAGLRVSEAVKLTARDIDSARMVLAIRQTKASQKPHNCATFDFGFVEPSPLIDDALVAADVICCVHDRIA